MRPALILLSCALLSACTEPAAAPPDDLRARQEAACTATIAAHIHRPATEITARWISQTGGIAKVETRDGNRLHLCDVDASGRVLGYTHPGA
ncbi:hypothetical protein [Paracoccus sp. PAR01]|uniref:hypothetical protein n=1 Tax=Paracoccus sp. PAR01 TaxID=2769282 RepID=UPI00177F40A8|nr:hypothetical protein [Paracoccus sp. PAR01]MBD9529829.1 hypothetical protein [Paracoccus sp. PAR01]